MILKCELLVDQSKTWFDSVFCLYPRYSAIIAEVPVRDDPATHLNTKLLQKLHACPQLVVCGQALSHCVNFTVRDIVDNWRGENSKIVLLKDGN